MKAYVILTQKQHSTDVHFEDKKGRTTEIKKDSIEIKKIGAVSRLFSSIGSRYMQIFFTRKDAIAALIDPSINDAILRSFEAAKAKGLVKPHHLKAFFLIKAMNIIINNKKKVYSCFIDREEEKEIIVEDGVKYARKVSKLEQEKVTKLQMKNSVTKAIPGVYNIISDILRVKKEFFDSMPKESREIAEQLKYGLVELPIKKIKAVDVIIQAIQLSKEMEEDVEKS